MSRRDRRGGQKRSYRLWAVLALVLVTGIVAYYIFTNSGTGSGSPLDGTAVSSTVLNDLSGVSVTTLDAVGPGASGVASPQPISGTALTLNSKPEILYMGAEYCPYCGAERWAMIVALDKFGNFTGLEYMQSSGTDVYPNTSTFTFVGATYSSPYISFVTVEQLDRSEAPLQTATAAETALLDQYDSGQGIPFVDFGNSYDITTAQYVPSALRVGDSPSGQPLNWTEAASQLNTPSSAVAMNVDGAANRIISVICKIDGGQPSSLCGQLAADFLTSYARPVAPGGSQLQVSDAVMTTQAPSTSRSPSGRSTYWV